MKNRAAVDLWDGMIAAGAAAVVIGIGMISVAAAVIVGGVLLIAGGLMGAARKGRRAFQAGRGASQEASK